MNRRTIKKWWILSATGVLYAMLLLAAYMLQGVVFPRLRIAGLVPLLLPAVGTGVAVYQGRIPGGIVGIIAGILCDISFNEPAGMFTVLLALTGLAVGYLADTVMTRGFAMYCICCAAVLALSAFAQMFTLLFFENAPTGALMSMALRQTVYSLIFAVPIWFFVKALGNRAQHKL